jgi:hypothetical protein
MEEPVQPTYSISVRIKRTVTEEIHVLVPVTSQVIDEQPDGSGRINGERVFAEAVRIGQTHDLAWRREGEPLVEIHPLQTPPPEYANSSET